MMRRENLKNIMTGKIRGRRGCGRPREIMLDGLKRWHAGILLIEAIWNTSYWGQWWPMDTHSIWLGTTWEEDDYSVQQGHILIKNKTTDTLIKVSTTHPHHYLWHLGDQSISWVSPHSQLLVNHKQRQLPPIRSALGKPFRASER